MKSKHIKLEDIKKSADFCELISAANTALEVRGYTEHGIRHVRFVSVTAGNILRELEFDGRTVELAEIAGYIHDIGNAVNRDKHGLIGAALAMPILSKMGMPPKETAVILGAIGNHEEQNGITVNPVCAAVILADKADAHRTRVRLSDYDPNDIHDRVNHAIKKNHLLVDKNKRVIKLVIFMDDTSSAMEFFQIYLARMVLSEQAASFLGCRFEIVINNMLINNHFDAKKADIKLSKTETDVSKTE